MKKWFVLTALVAFALVFNSCAGQEHPHQRPHGQPMAVVPDELDYAIRDISDYLNDNIPSGNRIVILNIESASAPLSDYIIDELIANAVNDRIFEVIDRQRLDLIRQEQDFQMSGEVDDELALSVGRFFGAQTIVSGRVMQVGDRFRITIRALDVETARIQGQYNRNLAAGPTINALMAAGGARPQAAPVATVPAGRQPPAAGIAPVAQAAPVVVVPPPITGTMVPGNNLAEMVVWLQRSAQSHGTYIVELTADEIIPPGTDLTFPGAINITLVLRGDGENRTLRLSSHGTMFTVRENVTAILDNNITLHGHAGNTAPLVVINGGTARKRTGAVITGNTGGGVRVARPLGIMGPRSIFTMSGGIISDNTASSGGGVEVVRTGTFEMSGGIISGNTSTARGDNGFRGGGGVFVDGGSIFTMTGGTISGNIANYGGGVFASNDGGSFYMRGGTIAGNIARERGGGVRASIWFNKTGGTITGHTSDQFNGNMVADENGNVWARRGHAVFVNDNTRRESTAGPGVNLSPGSAVPPRSRSGGWES